MTATSGHFRIILVDQEQREMRLDRFCRTHFPAATQGMIAKACRTGLIRIDGKKTTISERIATGQEVRIPHFMAEIGQREGTDPLPPAPPSKKWVSLLAASILYEDAEILVLNKPAGLPVQPGSGVTHSVDGCLPALAVPGQQLRLVHRLDKDTSGVLLLAKHRQSAIRYAQYFREHEVQKYYLAVALGVPRAKTGVITHAIQRKTLAISEDGEAAEKN